MNKLNFLIIVLILTFLTKNSQGEIIEHRISSLPGLDHPLPTKQWSGYIDLDLNSIIGRNQTASVHYWLIENSKKSKNAPTISWNQGGPGGSSMIGLWTENGPFTVNDFSFLQNGSMKVFENPFSWHHLGNLLYIELPVPTGFSKCEPNPELCTWNDTSQALVSYAFIEKFFIEYYPELKSNEFIMSGESYAGVLVPTLAEQILNHRTAENANFAPWNLKGFALGNACPGNRVFTCTPYSGWLGVQVAVDFRYYHGMISETTYKRINNACKDDWNQYDEPKSKECKHLLEDPISPVMSEAGNTNDMGGGYFLYDTCKKNLGIYHKKSIDLSILQTEVSRELVSANNSNVKSHIILKQKQNPTLFKKNHFPNNSGEYACGQERAALIYLNRKDVQEALHVKHTNFQFNTELYYNFTRYSLLNLYKSKLINQLNIMQYSGDADPCVPYVGTSRWIDSLNLQETKPWRPWVSPESQGIPAGYIREMSSYNNAKKFIFATVRDAGHMVPRYKPEETLHLMRKFLNIN